MAECVIALDTADEAEALGLYRRLAARIRWVKVGMELFTAAGPGVVAALRDAGARVFLDLKYHDIPNTVAGAVRAARRLGVAMCTVHAAGGRAMLEAAVEAAAGQLDVLAVTVLTSLSEADLLDLGVKGDLDLLVERSWRLARQAGVAGVVASVAEAASIRRAAGPDFLLVTPGIRPAGAAVADQKRVASPAAAVAAGSDFLVVGRAVTQALDPAAALEAVLAEMAMAEGWRP